MNRLRGALQHHLGRRRFADFWLYGRALCAASRAATLRQPAPWSLAGISVNRRMRRGVLLPAEPDRPVHRRCLAAGVFAGFTQGLIRYALNAVVVRGRLRGRVQLKGPMYDAAQLLEGVHPAAAPSRSSSCSCSSAWWWAAGSWCAPSTSARGCRSSKQLDELGGAVLGLLFAALSIVFLLVVMDSFFTTASRCRCGRCRFAARLLRGAWTDPCWSTSSAPR